MTTDFTPNADWQGVALYLGDGGEPVWVSDGIAPEDLRLYVETDLRRALVSARLQNIIDALK